MIEKPKHRFKLALFGVEAEAEGAVGIAGAIITLMIIAALLIVREYAFDPFLP